MSYNSKSMENLVPFRKGEDSRRQVGRKKGSLNMKTVMKTLLNEQATPDYIFSSGARERFRGMGDKTLRPSQPESLRQHSGFKHYLEEAS